MSMSLQAVYDNQWTLTNTHSGSLGTSGVFLGNGKIGINTHPNGLDIEKTVITTQLKYYNGIYKPNITYPFKVTDVKFFTNIESGTTYACTSETLNMYTAIYTSLSTATNDANNNVLNLSTDLYVPRQLPFCVIKTIRITPQQNLTELDFFHEVESQPDMTNVEYNNNVIYNETISPTKGLYILSGKAKDKNMENEYAFATCYLLEVPETDYDNLGFNVYVPEKRRCYNKFRLRNLLSGTTYKVHVISSILSSNDFEAPIEEVKRIVINIANKGTSPTQTANVIRSDHCDAWAELWKTDIVINPKSGITAEESAELSFTKRMIRYSLYNMYSSVRENVNVEVNPLNLSLIDLDGSVLYDGDLWFIPILLITKPDVARALLENRYKVLDVARQLAAGYGFKGAKFPYVNDALGYKNTLYYDLSGALSIFNTALISINVWNYFRMTKDRDWLSQKGYSILKENADFFVSKVEKDGNGKFHIKNVLSIGGVQNVDNNSFTNNMVNLALRAAIEASYELNTPVKDGWLDCHFGLDIEYFSVDDFPPMQKQVIKFNSADTKTSTYDIMEPFFIMLPYYSKKFFSQEENHYLTTVKLNLDAWDNNGKLKASMGNQIFNLALRASMLGLYAQYDPAFTDDYYVALCNVVKTKIDTVWGNMNAVPGKSNDVSINAIYLFVLIQGLLQANIKGGVAESKFYYEEMKLDVPPTVNMPISWKSVKLAGVGSKAETFTVINSMYYVAGSATCGC